MDSVIAYLFGAASFVPHGYCLLWRPDLVAMHAVSDTGIAASYFAIPMAIMALGKRRGDFTGDARLIALLFVTFIVACGVTHLIGLVTLWYPLYGLQALIKVATGIVSVITAVVVWRMLPQLVALPSPAKADAMNRRLRQEATAREAAYRELESIRADLERQVAERTAELRQANDLFNLATNGAQIGVFAQDRDLRYTWIHNPPFGMTPQEVVGQTDADIMPEPARSEMLPAKRRVLETGKPETFEIEIPEGELSSWFRINVIPLRQNGEEVDGVVSTAIDISRSKQLEEMRTDLSRRLSATVQHFNIALRSADIIVFSQDTDLRYTWTNASFIDSGPMLGQTDDDVFNDNDRGAIIQLKRRAMETREAQVGEVRVDSGEEVRWYLLHIEPDLTVDDEVRGVTGAAVDISDRKENERQMRLVMRELSHRSKNLLAVVQAISRLTAQQSESVTEFLAHFGARLRALAGAQDLLVAENWAGARLGEVVLGQLGHYTPEDKTRVVVEGPELMLSPEAMQTLSLALHELATNATKYGALSNDVGFVRVDWEIDRTGNAPTVILRWHEEGGPEVAMPRRRGFGRIVIERNVARALGADIDLDFAPAGLRAVFRIPLSELVSRNEGDTNPKPTLE